MFHLYLTEMTRSVEVPRYPLIIAMFHLSFHSWHFEPLLKPISLLKHGGNSVLYILSQPTVPHRSLRNRSILSHTAHMRGE